MIFPAGVRYRMGASTDAKFVSQEIRFFLIRVGRCEIGIDSAFAALNIASGLDSRINLILSEKGFLPGNFCHIRGIFPPGQGQFLQPAGSLSGVIEVKAHQLPVICKGI